MAKAKKESSKEASAKQSPATKPAAHKPGPAKAKASSPAAKPAAKPMMGSSMIDTSRAAENAARHLVAGLNRKGSLNPAGGKSSNPESSTFKQMKSGLNKHGSNAMDALLDKTHGPNSTNSGAHGFDKKQVGHNQTVGSDAARANVPRRTAGVGKRVMSGREESNE